MDYRVRLASSRRSRVGRAVLGLTLLVGAASTTGLVSLLLIMAALEHRAPAVDAGYGALLASTIGAVSANGLDSQVIVIVPEQGIAAREFGRQQNRNEAAGVLRRARLAVARASEDAYWGERIARVGPGVAFRVALSRQRPLSVARRSWSKIIATIGIVVGWLI